MPTVRERLQDAPTLAHMAELLCREHGTDRVSIARLHRADGTFEIVASAGKALLGPGLRVPVRLSTQIDVPAHGDVFCAPSFDEASGWGRPVDHLMLGLGFGSGCSLALGPPAAPVGALSLSATGRHRDYDASLDALAAVADVVADRMACAVRAPNVLVLHDDDVLAEGLVSVIERRLDAHAWWWATMAETAWPLGAPRFDAVVCAGHLACPATVAALRDAGIDAPLIVLARRDSPFDRHTALTAGAAAYAVLHGDGPGVVDAIAAVAAGQTELPASLRDHDAIVTLTPRESDILLDLDDGLRFKDIARRRGITELTAKTYARSLFRKLGAHSRTEAVNAARADGRLDALRGADRAASSSREP